ncbi:MAG: M36 family metallopeptidase [Pseudonocardiaceae bacterium]
MSRELDVRDFSVDQSSQPRLAELESRAAAVSELLPRDHVVVVTDIDPTTGNAARIVSTASAAGEADFVQRALDHAQEVSSALGLTSRGREFVADPHALETSAGGRAVNLQQTYKGIPIFQSAQTVRFEPDGRIGDIIGSTIEVSSAEQVTTRLSVQEAVLRAAAHVAEPDDDERGTTDQFGQPLTPATVNLGDWRPTVRAAFGDSPRLPTVLDPGPFGSEIRSSLTWFPRTPDTITLAYEINLSMPDGAGRYDTVVDATTGDILYCRRTDQTVVARGNVYLTDPRQPRMMTDMPQPMSAYSIPPPVPPLSDGFPMEWVAEDQTVGTCTVAHQGVAGPPLQCTSSQGTVTFDPFDAFGPDQQTLNIFFYCCVMHDVLYSLGFREADGNFQADDLGGGAGNDPVDARAFPAPVQGTANMTTPADGRSPVMNMGLVDSTNRHTAFDSSVVFHEYTHGLTNRLVGGRINTHALDSIQSGGMGEGWSDYMACMLSNSTVIGDWVVNNPTGIRAFPYDSAFPDGFGKLGTGRYGEVHNIGEIWCATLMEISRQIDRGLALQLVVDALKLTPPNPSFLAARDAIFLALDHTLTAGTITAEVHAQTKKTMWTVFAHFGMGPAARSNGAQLSGIVADHNAPAD